MSLGMGELAKLDLGPGDPAGPKTHVQPRLSALASPASTSGTST